MLLASRKMKALRGGTHTNYWGGQALFGPPCKNFGGTCPLRPPMDRRPWQQVASNYFIDNFISPFPYLYIQSVIF